MYKGKFASELSMNEVKEYYDELRQKCLRTDEEWADFDILQEKLIVFAYKILDGKTNSDVIKAMFPDGIKIDRSTAYAKRVTEDWLNSPYEASHD